MKALLDSFTSLLADLHPVAMGMSAVLLFGVTIVFMPWAVARIPTDYFKHSAVRPRLWSGYHPFLRLMMILAKNLLGLVLVVLGVLMVILPGPGIVTMLVGLVLLDVPGKFRFERWLLSHHFVLQPVNWLRAKMHKPALQLD